MSLADFDVLGVSSMVNCNCSENKQLGTESSRCL